MLWFEAKENAKVIGKAPERQPKKGEAWVPKYPNVGDILAEYGRTEPDLTALPEGIDAVEIAAIAAALEAETEPEF